MSDVSTTELSPRLVAAERWKEGKIKKKKKERQGSCLRRLGLGCKDRSKKETPKISACTLV